MNWEGLYTPRRTGDAGHKQRNPDQARNSYMRDYDRIIFSSAFRRLQNKTQVFPLPGPVFVHNRLTHSLEVASVGRSLGKIAGEKIADKYAGSGTGFDEFYRHELAYVVASACLAHDIGNPPFGHSGEDAIRAFFTTLEGTDKQRLEQELTPNQLLDFQRFEGNSNALRTLTHNFAEPEPGGYRLTYTTLASIVKYPCSSATGFNKQKGIHAKKSGFFDSEMATYRSMAQDLGIPELEDNVFARHPFVYLVEAADDICYRVVDLEDAHRLGIITLEKFKSLLLPFFEGSKGYNNREWIEQKLSNINDANQQAQYIRANWIGLMVQKLADLFMEHEELLLAGALNKDLLACLPEHECALVKEINTFSYRHIYNHRSVVEIELSGFHIIGTLLKDFIRAVLHPEEARSEKLLLLVPAQFPVDTDRPQNLYGNIQSVVDFIAGMTDLFAIDLYQKISGIHISRIG
ncbi:MAG TPA: dNTP triphosphohydrolase [Chitinophagaceae bacterium]|nr:dNTP triphosphohydrolase [Chitinophagaceae bacterium]